MSIGEDVHTPKDLQDEKPSDEPIVVNDLGQIDFSTFKRYKVNLTFTFEIGRYPLEQKNLAKEIEDALNEDTWNEGRHCFAEELIDEGLTQRLKQAVDSTILSKLIQTYKNQIVQSPDGKTKWGRAYYEHERTPEPIVHTPCSFEWEVSDAQG